MKEQYMQKLEFFGLNCIQFTQSTLSAGLYRMV